MPSAVRPDYAFSYVSAGEMVVTIAEESCFVREHDFLLIPPGVPFSIKYYSNARGYMGSFRESFLKNTSYRILHCGRQTLFSLSPDDYFLFDELMNKLFRESAASGGMIAEGSESQTARSILDCLIALADSMAAITGISGNQMVSSYIEELFSDKEMRRNVSEYAACRGVSPNYLNRTVKASTGKTAGEWLYIARISRAKTMLRNPECSMIDVSFAVGIDDQAYFSRFFKREVGMTPSAYRRSLQAYSGSDSKSSSSEKS